jgi:hypothetical protein
MIRRTIPIQYVAAWWQAGTFDTRASSEGAACARRRSNDLVRRGHRLHTRKGYFDKVHDEGAVQDAMEHYE